MRKERATWDDGWVGKGVNSAGGSCDSNASRIPEVKDSDDRLLLYSIENGEMYRLWYKERIGFVRR